MRRKCCVPNCDSGTRCDLCQIDICYFKLPKDIATIKQWELALGMKARGFQTQDRVCSSHFRHYDIVVKRFIPLKRPNTNSRMILEISRLNRHAVPSLITSVFTKPCTHERDRRKSSMRCNGRSSRTESATSEPVSSPSDDTDDSSTDDRQKRRKTNSTPNRKDYRAIAESIANRSNRRQIRALTNLRAKWVGKKKTLTRDIRLLEVKITEIARRCDEKSGESD